MSHLLINGIALLMSMLFPQNVLRIQSQHGLGACSPSKAFIQAEFNTNSGTNSITQPFDSNNTQGCFIVAGIGVYSISGGGLAFEDSNGNGLATSPFTHSYTQLNNGFNTDTRVIDAGIGWAPNIAAGANTVTGAFVGSSLTGNLDIVISEFSGVSSEDQQGTSFCSAAGTPCTHTMTTPSITIAQTELVVSYIYDYTRDHAWTVPGGWTICAQCATHDATHGELGTGRTSALAYQVLTAGTYSLTWTSTAIGTSDGTIYFIQSYK